MVPSLTWVQLVGPTWKYDSHGRFRGFIWLLILLTVEKNTKHTHKVFKVYLGGSYCINWNECPLAHDQLWLLVPARFYSCTSCRGLCVVFFSVKFPTHARRENPHHVNKNSHMQGVGGDQGRVREDQGWPWSSKWEARLSTNWATLRSQSGYSCQFGWGGELPCLS